MAAGWYTEMWLKKLPSFTLCNPASQQRQYIHFSQAAEKHLKLISFHAMGATEGSEKG